MIAGQSIDIVLLDVMMPGLSGYDVCRKIKENDMLRNTPVIMITALTAKEDRIRGIEAGADDFISKPFDQAEVLARIKMLLKMKTLNDRLSQAYDTLIALNAHGEADIRDFNQMDFDLISKIDRIVNLVIRQRNNIPDKPRFVLVRLLNAYNNYEWYQYEYVFDNVSRAPIALNAMLEQEMVKGSQTFFCNQQEVKKQFKNFSEKLSEFTIQIENMVCYLSNTLCIFGINYGRDVSKYDAAVLNSLVMHTLFLRSLAIEIKEVDDAFAYTVYSLARAAEANDEDTGNHVKRVGEYCALLARRIGMPDTFVENIRTQALLHDVGKIHVPELLRKPGALSPGEWETMKKHTLFGAMIIGNHAKLNMAKEIALTHHERWDGSGYPYGLKKDQIPISGLISSMADQYDALRNKRVYKPSLDHKMTCKIITEGDGRTLPHHFAPQVLKAFRDAASQFDEIYEKLKV